MPKKGVRIVITGRPRPKIDVEAMAQIIIALGRELAARKPAQRQIDADNKAGSAP